VDQEEVLGRIAKSYIAVVDNLRPFNGKDVAEWHSQ
jgi:hypothetical protein